MRGSIVAGVFAACAVYHANAAPFNSAPSTPSACTNTTAASYNVSECQSSSSATNTVWPDWAGHGPKIDPSVSLFPKPYATPAPETYDPTAPLRIQYPDSREALTPMEKCEYLEYLNDETFTQGILDNINATEKDFSEAISAGKLMPVDIVSIRAQLLKASDDFAILENETKALMRELHLCKTSGSLDMQWSSTMVDKLRYKQGDIEYRQLELTHDRFDNIDYLIQNAIFNKVLPGNGYSRPDLPQILIPLDLSLLNSSTVPTAASTNYSRRSRTSSYDKTTALSTSTTMTRDVDIMEDDSAEKRKCPGPAYHENCTPKYDRQIAGLMAKIGQEKNQVTRQRLEKQLQVVKLERVLSCAKLCPQQPKHPKQYPKQIWAIVSGIIRGLADLLDLNGGSRHPEHGNHPSPPSYHPMSTSNSTLQAALQFPKSTGAANYTSTPYPTSSNTTISTVHTTPAPDCTSSTYGTGNSSVTHPILSSSTSESSSSVVSTSHPQPLTPSSTQVSTPSSNPVTSGPVVPQTSSMSSSNSEPTSSQSYVPKPHSTTHVQHTYAPQPSHV